MCGIVGIIGYDEKDILRKMNNAQIHRGPDDEGVYWEQENRVGLAMRRLAIVDLESGKQPMTNEDGDVIVVFNGEIFNAPALRKKLLAKGHKFVTTNSDTEVLVHLYEEAGIDMVKELNGMFAFAVYDKMKQRILVARDQMGIKPLHYHAGNGKFMFASELKSILVTGVSEKNIDRQSLWDYLSFQCVPADRTIYDDIKILPAGHFLVYNVPEASFAIREYWNCIDDRKIYDGKREELTDFLREEIENAIERWTMSDVPLACSLSGGLDSSIIASVISKKRELHTYTLGFEYEEYDERGLAKQLSNMYGTKHTEIVLGENEVIQSLPEIAKSLESPYAGGIPSWFICKAVHRNEKVLFNGTGGDELFGNYGKWLRYEHPYARYTLIKHHKSVGEDWKEIFKYPNGSIYHKYIGEGVKRKILKEENFEHIRNTNEWCEKMFKECPSKNWRDKVPYLDFHIQLPEEFLMMIDRFSMRYSIEARVPFLDRELVENTMGVGCDLRTKKYQYKYLLKEVAKDLLPQEYFSAPKKGFVLPYREWLLGDLKKYVQEFTSQGYLKRQNIFTDGLYKTIIEPFYQGRYELTPYVWTVFMFQMWYENRD